MAGFGIRIWGLRLGAWVSGCGLGVFGGFRGWGLGA